MSLDAAGAVEPARSDSRRRLLQADGHPGWRLSSDRRGMLRPAFWFTVGLLLSMAYKHAADFTPMTSAGLPHPLFPTQAVVLSVLLVTPIRQWWLYLAAYYGVLVLEGTWWSGLPEWYLLVSNVANVVEPLVGALLLRRFIPLPPRFSHLREVGFYVACVAAASAVGATWGASTRAVGGFSFWLSLRGWFLGDVLASLLLAPTILLYMNRGVRGPWLASRRRAVEAALLSLGLLVVGSLVFGTQSQGADTAPALLYVPVPLLVWAAVRFGPRGITAALSLITVLAIAGVVNGLGPFVERPVPASVFTLQLFLLGVGVPLFCLAALVQERQSAQMRLEQSEERYRAVVSNFPHGAVLLFGPDLRHHFADGRGLPELNLSGESIVGRTPAEAFPADVAAGLVPRYQAALTGEHSAFDVVHVGRIYQAQVLPISLAETTSGMVVMQEVTDQRRADELTRLDRAKTAFFSNVSHEFRTPLTLLLGPLQEVLAAPRHDVTPEARVQLETAHRNALRLLKLVNTLLDISRLEAGRFQAVYVPTDLAAYTAELVSMFRSAIEQAGLRLVLHCPTLAEPIYVDRDQWEHIVFNLLSNAIKFTFSGEIVVTLGVEDGHAVLAVHDTGIGIAPDELPHLFDRFHQARRSRARTQEGSGIGLALVQELAKLHGGAVQVTSTPGRGSTFTVAIPRGTAHLPLDQVDATPVPTATVGAARASLYTEEARSWLPNAPDHDGPTGPVRAEAPAGVRSLGEPATMAASASGPAGRPVRILVADDNADMRAYLVRLLGGRGIVEAVADGTVALEAIRAWQPDLVVTDMMMPGLDGFGLLQAVRADPELRSVSIILLSARAGEEARVEGLRAGADDYLVKPFAAAELLARVDAQLSLVGLRHEAWTAAERQRLAYDLHDSVTQSLYSLTLLAEAGRRAVVNGNRTQADECLERLGETAQQALRELRLLVSQQRPPVLSDLGLIRALEQRLDAVERRAGITARVVATGELALTPAAEEAFYYIIQEALNNALKHAAATEVVVRIASRRAATELLVLDNGCGFDPAALTGRGGLGLVSIRERAASMGASVAIGRHRRGGTRVAVRLHTNRQRPADGASGESQG